MIIVGLDIIQHNYSTINIVPLHTWDWMHNETHYQLTQIKKEWMCDREMTESERDQEIMILNEGILLISNSVKTHNDIKLPLVLLNSLAIFTSCTPAPNTKAQSSCALLFLRFFHLCCLYPHIFPSEWPCMLPGQCTAHRDLWPLQQEVVRAAVFTALLICLSLGGDTCSSDYPRRHRAGTHVHSQFHPNCVHTKTLIQRYNIKTDPQAQYWYC